MSELIGVFLVPMSVQHGLHIIIYPLAIIYTLTMALLYFCYHRPLHQQRLPIGNQSIGHRSVSRLQHGVGPNPSTRGSINNPSGATGSAVTAARPNEASEFPYPVGFAQCSIFSTMLFALFTLDFWTDLLFTITLWFNTQTMSLAFASTIFLAAPYISGLTTYFYALRRWRAASTPHVKYWMERYDWLLNGLVIISGEAYSPILLMSSFVLYNDTFSLHLPKSELYSVRMTRFFTRFFFANFPQFAIQSYYLTRSSNDANSYPLNEVFMITVATTSLAILFEVISVVIGVQNIPCLSRPLDCGVKFEIEMDVEVNQFHLHAAHEVLNDLLGKFLSVPVQDVEVFDIRRFKDVGFDSVGVYVHGIVRCKLNDITKIEAAIYEMGSEKLDEFNQEVITRLRLPMSTNIHLTNVRILRPDGKTPVVQDDDDLWQQNTTANDYKVLTWNTWGIVFASPRTLTNPNRCAKYVQQIAIDEDWEHYEGVIVMCFQEIWAFRVGYMCHIWLYFASFFEYMPWLGIITSAVSVFCSLLLGFVPFFNELYEPKHGVIRILMDYLPFYYGPSRVSCDWKKPLDSGLLIMTNRPITQSGFEAYGDSTGDDSMANKGFMWVYCQSQNLLVINTHLQHAGTGPQRKRQLGQIRRFLDEEGWRDREDIDILVMGDFNIAMDDPQEAQTAVNISPNAFESPSSNALATAISNGSNGQGHFPIPTNSPADDGFRDEKNADDRDYVGVHDDGDFTNMIGTDPPTLLRLNKFNDYSITHLKKRKCIDHILTNLNHDDVDIENSTWHESLRSKMSDHALVRTNIQKVHARNDIGREES